MWAFLANLVLGLPGLADGLFKYLAKRSDNTVLTNGQNVTGDVTIAQAQLTAYVEERKAIAAERAANGGSLWTCWMLPAAFGVSFVHYAAIVLDSTFLLNWQVAKLPAPYDQMEWQIIGAAVGFSGVARLLGRRIFKA